MASPIDVMLKQQGSVGMATVKSSQTERRSSRRCKITQLMRVRPSDPEKDNFDDIRGSHSVSRTGVYFQSSETGYDVGMRLFVTMPYTKEPTSMQREYLAEVVRRDQLPNGLYGIGFKILMEMGFQGGYSADGYSHRK
jgi:PilZ domain